MGRIALFLVHKGFNIPWQNMCSNHCCYHKISLCGTNRGCILFPAHHQSSYTIVRFTRVLCRLRCVHHNRYTHKTSAQRSAPPILISAIRHKLGLTVTIITADYMLTLSCENLIGAEVFLYPFVMERPLFIPDATFSKNHCGINAFRRFLRSYHLGVLWHKLNLP